MTLKASRFRELKNTNLSVGGRAERCCELAKEFENKGEYEKAREVLSRYWRRIGERPNVEDLEPSTAAEVLLRVGVLTGAIGSKHQIADAQETAKNLISESITIFESQRYRKKVTEAQTELALCYWRTGEINEARDFLKEALSHLTTDSELKAKAIIRLTVVEHSAGHNEKALRMLTSNAALFEKLHSDLMKGSYHVTLGNRLENLWESRKQPDYVDRALIEYAAASYHFEQAGHRCYLANVENNLGFLYFTINQIDKAHEHLDRARHVLMSLKDAGGVAQVDETRACVLLQQNRISEAERVARSAVRGLEKTGSHDLLAEALITHGRALARLKNYGTALSSFRRAIDLYERVGIPSHAAEAALAAFQEIGDRLIVADEKQWQLSSGRGLREEKRSLEHDVIKLALENAKGSVVHAARSLGISYQALVYMLNTRHKDLYNERTPPLPRPRRRKRPI